LLLYGGGAVSTECLAAFADAAGGREASIVLIPTANCGFGGGANDDAATQVLREHGFAHIQVLHTRDPEEANSSTFVDVLRTADGVWISGGGTECLVAPYLDTLLQEELAGVLARGGIVAGTSAGAIGLDSYFEVRLGEPRGFIEFEGFGLMRNTSIAAHTDRRPEALSDLVHITETQLPGMLGIGLDEATYVLVRGDTLTVEGNGSVHVVSCNSRTQLRRGGTYDLRRRRTD
jgi:cyanophycinase